jgi:Arc/MetJ family transcription regulator
VEYDLLYFGIMKTTVDIPDQMMREAMRHAKADTKREAVLAAMDDFNRRHRQASLIRHLGTTQSRQARERRHGARR